MTLLLDIALRSAALLLVALVACVFLRRRSAALRHWVLTAGLVAAAAVIPLTLVVPSVPIALLGRPTLAPEVTVTAVEGAAPIDAGREPARAWPHLRDVVLVTWAAGAAIGMTFLLVGLGRLLRMTHRATRVVDGPWLLETSRLARQYGIRRSIMLLETDTHDVVATWGIVRPRILLPVQARGWGDEWSRVVLCHELAHIRRWDWPVQVLAEVLRAVLWFNPLLWIACARLRRESEHACDDAVLGAGVPAASYARHLVDIARACRVVPRHIPAMPIARPSTLEGRITAMLNTTLDRRAPTRTFVTLTLVLLFGVLLPAAALRLSAQAGPSTLTGHVYDTSGGVLPAAEVVLVDAQEVKWPTTTDSSGRFEFAPVGAGRYVLQVSLPGFRTLRHEFELREAGNWSRAITMQVGELEETITVTARRPANAPAPSALAAGAVRIGGNIKPPLKLKDVRPVYPPAMRDAGLEGRVPMEALIGLDGSVVSVQMLSAQVHPEFAKAAEDAVRQWRFSSTLLNGAPVEVRMTVSVQFSLSD